MTACSPPRASGQLLVPARVRRSRKISTAGARAPRALSPRGACGGWGLAAPLPTLWLCPTRASHILRRRGASGSRVGGPMPRAVGTAAGGYEGRERSCGRVETKSYAGGRRRGGGTTSRAIAFLSPAALGGEPQDADRSLTESEAELLRGWTGRPFKAVVGAGAWTERSLPPPPGVPALLCPSLRQMRSARTVPVGSDRAAAASSTGRRTGGSSWHHRC